MMNANDPILRAAMLTQMQNKEFSTQPDVAAMEAEMAAKRQQKQTPGVDPTMANPYVAGAGIALQGIGMVDDAKRQNEQAQIDAYNNKIMAQRSAIRNIFS